MCLTIDELRGLCTPDNIYLTLHASKRLEQRGILIDDVISCIMTGEIIEEYPNDYHIILFRITYGRMFAIRDVNIIRLTLENI